jgi:hypothetical protein
VYVTIVRVAGTPTAPTRCQRERERRTHQLRLVLVRRRGNAIGRVECVTGWGSVHGVCLIWWTVRCSLSARDALHPTGVGGGTHSTTSFSTSHIASSPQRSFTSASAMVEGRAGREGARRCFGSLGARLPSHAARHTPRGHRWVWDIHPRGRTGARCRTVSCACSPISR